MSVQISLTESQLATLRTYGLPRWFRNLLADAEADAIDVGPCIVCGELVGGGATRCERCQRNLEEDRMRREIA